MYCNVPANARFDVMLKARGERAIKLTFLSKVLKKKGAPVRAPRRPRRPKPLRIRFKFGLECVIFRDILQFHGILL